LDRKELDLNSIRLDAFEHIKKDFPKIMKEGAELWIPLQTIGYVVPDHLKVL